MDAQDINISVTGDVLTIKGEKKSEREEKEANYHLVERNYGSFSRSLKLPAAVELDKIEAKYDKGVLTVTCPRKRTSKPRPSRSRRPKAIPPACRPGLKAAGRGNLLFRGFAFMMPIDSGGFAWALAPARKPKKPRAGYPGAHLGDRSQP